MAYNATRGNKSGDAKMKIIIWLIVLLLAAIGVATIADYSGAYDVPMIDVSLLANTMLC